MNSIRRVMLVWLLGTVSVVMAIAGAFSYRAGLQEAGEMFDAKLAHSSRVLMSLVDEPLSELGEHGPSDPVVVDVWHGEANGVGEALAFPGGHAYETKLAFQVRDANGTLLLRSDSGPVDALAPLRAGYDDVEIDGRDWRTFTAMSSGGRWYQAGERSDIREEIAEDIAFGTLVPLLVALPILAVVIWLIVTWACQVLSRVSSQIEHREAANLSPLQLERVPAEINGVVVAVNGLISRLRTALERERRFTADAAHELRTPISALKVHADNLAGARDDAERAESQSRVQASADRLHRLVGQMLSLSRLEPGMDAGTRGTVALDGILEAQAIDHGPLANARGIDLAIDSAHVQVQGDAVALSALVRNLLDNAVRYASPGGKVRASLSVAEGDACLRVEDDGPGIPPGARERVFERFHRELGSGVEGSGLGLSIVRRSVELHGGSILLDESPTLSGLRVTVRIPVAAAPTAAT